MGPTMHWHRGWQKGLGGLTGGRSTESCITSIAPTPFFTSPEPKIYCKATIHQLPQPPFYTSLEPKIYYKAAKHHFPPPFYNSQCSVDEQ